jgi:hypothetical protein
VVACPDPVSRLVEAGDDAQSLMRINYEGIVANHGLPDHAAA